MGGTNLELARCADALEILSRLAVLVAKEEYGQDILTPQGRLPKFDPDVSYADQAQLALHRIEAELSGVQDRDDADVVTYENVAVHGDVMTEEEKNFLKMFE